MSEPLLAETFLSILGDLERRVRALESSPQLTSASIKEGALSVYDNAGVVRARVGKQTDGSYDIESFDAAGANPVKLSTLAFGQTFGEVLPEETTTSTTYTDLATVGPTVTATVGASGKAIVMAGAYMTSTVTNQTVATGVSVDGAAAFDIALLGNNTSGSVSGDHSSATMLSGLSAGSHTFRLKYLQSLGGATGRFGGRWVLVFPF